MTEEQRDSMPGWASLALRIVDGLSFDAPDVPRHLEPSNFDLFFAISLHTLGVVVTIASDSRHSGWRAYKQQTGLLVPWALFTGRAWHDLFRADVSGIAEASEAR